MSKGDNFLSYLGIKVLKRILTKYSLTAKFQLISNSLKPKLSVILVISIMPPHSKEFHPKLKRGRLKVLNLEGDSLVKVDLNMAKIQPLLRFRQAKLSWIISVKLMPLAVNSRALVTNKLYQLLRSKVIFKRRQKLFWRVFNQKANMKMSL